MAAELHLALAGEPVVLHADRALYWPRGGSLMIADLHLGKGDAFRRAGVAVPSGGTRDDLGRLDRLVRHFEPRALWILGDVLHGAVHDVGWRATWTAWRDAHAQVDVAAVIGNHDRALADARLGIAMLGRGIDAGPFALRHEPAPSRLHVVCGHLHPWVRLPGLGMRRWPAFWLGTGTTVLPAFSAFTGGAPIAAGEGTRVVVCADGAIAEVGARP